MTAHSFREFYEADVLGHVVKRGKGKNVNAHLN